MKMSIGLGSYTYTWAVLNGMSPMELIRLAKEKGVNVVELCDNIPLAEYDNGILKKIKKAVTENSMILHIGTRGTSKEHLTRFFEIAEKTGAKLLRTMINEDTDGTDRSAEFICGNINSVLKDYEKSDIKIDIENYEKQKTKWLARLMEMVNSPYFGVCLDTVNSFGNLESPEQVIKNLAPYAIELHLKDFTISRANRQMGFTVQGTPTGEGLLDIPGLVSILSTYNRCETAVIELWTPFEDSVEKTVQKESLWADRSIKFVKDLFC